MGGGKLVWSFRVGNGGRWGAQGGWAVWEGLGQCGLEKTRCSIEGSPCLLQTSGHIGALPRDMRPLQRELWMLESNNQEVFLNKVGPGHGVTCPGWER